MTNKWVLEKNFHSYYTVAMEGDKEWVIPQGHLDKIRRALDVELEELPMLLIEEKLPVPHVIVKWRLEIGK
jgi:hypothetical protein